MPRKESMPARSTAFVWLGFDLASVRLDKCKQTFFDAFRSLEVLCIAFVKRLLTFLVLLPSVVLDLICCVHRELLDNLNGPLGNFRSLWTSDTAKCTNDNW